MHCMMGKLQSLGGLKHVFCSVLAKNANFGTRLCTDQKQTASLGYCKMQSTSWRSCRSILSIRHALCGKKIRLYEALKYVFWAVWTKKAKFSTSLRTDKRQTAGVSHCQIQSTYWVSCGNILSIIHALHDGKITVSRRLKTRFLLGSGEKRELWDSPLHRPETNS
jgi:hypothetical protein